MNLPAYSYRADAAVPDFADDKPIIVFDGHCVLCSRWANIIIRHDKTKRFRLLAAQSPLGEALYAHYGMKSGDYDTNLLIENGYARIKSDGTLAMMNILGGPWKLAGIFRIIPAPLRDRMYDVIAKNRLKWFGRKDVCYLPRPEDKDRFL